MPDYASPIPAIVEPLSDGRPRGLTAMGFGGDYNPEQWPEATRREDIELMQQAGVNFVSLGIFSWGLLEKSEGEFDFGWLDAILDQLHGAGIRVALATSTASPPAWLASRHPEILPQDENGTVLHFGSRQSYCPSSAIYAEHSLRLVRTIARRYASHPALALWHVDNELGCHNAHCYCDTSAAAFRAWLEDRYGDIDSLNESWGTSFWSQHYGDFAQIGTPRASTYSPNPTQQLDFRRFSSDALRAIYQRQLAVVREETPDIPVTTNFMVPNAKDINYQQFGTDVDVVANDHYLVAADPLGEIDLAFSGDFTRGIAEGKPWILMENAIGAVNWQPRNRAKGEGESFRNSMCHVARGADSIMFFQWRQSKAGAEKFHSALLPHAGTDSHGWRETVRLGSALKALSEVRGSVVESKVALIADYEAWWATELDARPSGAVEYKDQVMAYYRSLWELGISVDVVGPAADLDAYDLIFVCTQYLVTDANAARVTEAAERGASVVVTYFSGIVDESDQIRLGGYPGAYRELLGVRSDEFFPLLEGDSVNLDNGHTADLWAERVELRGTGAEGEGKAEAKARYVSGALAGVPAVTRREMGHGNGAWYVATRLEHTAVKELVIDLLGEARIAPVAVAPAGVEVVRRRGEKASYLFVINHTDSEVEVRVEGTEILRNYELDGAVHVAPLGVAVVRETVC